MTVFAAEEVCERARERRDTDTAEAPAGPGPRSVLLRERWERGDFGSLR